MTINNLTIQFAFPLLFIKKKKIKSLPHNTLVLKENDKNNFHYQETSTTGILTEGQKGAC